MLGAGMSLRADRSNHLTAARVERTDNPHFNRRTPGSMTLLRPVWTRASSPARWPIKPAVRATAPYYRRASRLFHDLTLARAEGTSCACSGSSRASTSSSSTIGA
jgi:hypothetical protein